MTTTPIYGLTEWSGSQASPWVPENAAKRVLEAVGRGSVADRDLSAPPGSCADGASYLVKATGTGLWATHDGQMAISVGTNAANGWLFATVATEGQFLWIEDEAIRIQYASGVWATVSLGGYTPGGTDVAVADGGTGSSTASGALTNLGGTTVGVNVFTLTNPSAITFLRLNADNSVSALSASAFRTAIGAGTGTGGGDMLAANNLSDVASAATSRTNLGGTTIGQAVFTLTNPSAVTFPRYNADNTVTARTAANMRTDLGLVIGTDIPARSPSIQAVSSSATVAPTFADDQVNITAQAAALTLANPTGTAVDGWGVSVRIKDNGTARAISYGTQYRALGVTLPTTTVISKTLYLGMVFNNADTKWDVVAVAQEA